MPEMHPLDQMSPSHLGALAVSAAAGWFLTASGRSQRVPLRRWEVALGVLLLLMHPAEILVSSKWGLLTKDNMLPLHLCDVVGIISGIALLSKRQIFIELAWFWGMSGTLQALLTPTLNFDFPHPSYFRYFGLHSTIVIAAIYLVCGQRYYPRPGSVWRAWLLINVYLLVTTIVNYLLSSNYGYTCEKPTAASLMDYLGPWPWYILSLELLALMLFLLLDWPFHRLRKAKDWPPSAENPL